MGRLDKKMMAYVAERLNAANGGQAEALYDLGLLYSTGHGVDVDIVAAHKWFNLAAMMGVERANVDRRELAEEMSLPEVAAAQKMAREWVQCH